VNTTAEHTTRSSVADWWAMAGSAFVALLGFLTSFKAVSFRMRPDFGALAPAVPVGVDAGILVSSAAYLSLARRDEAPRWLRLVPHGLTGATVYLNLMSGQSPAGRIAHAVMVGLWAVAVEAAVHVVRHRLGLETGTRMDRIRRSRWLLAPLSTALLWRRMVLWEITSYRTALAHEQRRVLARMTLRQTYGRWWRWRAPAGERLALRTMSRLGPAPATSPPAPARPAVQRPTTTPRTAGKRAPRARTGKRTDPARWGEGKTRAYTRYAADRSEGLEPDTATLAEVGGVTPARVRHWRADFAARYTAEQAARAARDIEPRDRAA
jgi:hypothetical protein